MNKMIENDASISLTRRESMRIFELLEKPPVMNDKLTLLMADYDRRKLDDAHSVINWSLESCRYETRGIMSTKT